VFSLDAYDRRKKGTITLSLLQTYRIINGARNEIPVQGNAKKGGKKARKSEEKKEGK
jgi:hypothetical protein